MTLQTPRPVDRIWVGYLLSLENSFINDARPQMMMIMSMTIENHAHFWGIQPSGSVSPRYTHSRHDGCESGEGEGFLVTQKEREDSTHPKERGLSPLPSDTVMVNGGLEVKIGYHRSTAYAVMRRPGNSAMLVTNVVRKISCSLLEPPSPLHSKYSSLVSFIIASDRDRDEGTIRTVRAYEIAQVRDKDLEEETVHKRTWCDENDSKIRESVAEPNDPQSHSHREIRGANERQEGQLTLLLFLLRLSLQCWFSLFCSSPLLQAELIFLQVKERWLVSWKISYFDDSPVLLCSRLQYLK